MHSENFLSQAFGVLMGLYLTAVGAAVLYSIADWWRRGVRTEGTVMGVRRQGVQIHSVYRYLSPAGQWREATSAQGSIRPDGRTTGAQVVIQVTPGRSPGAAEEVREAPARATWLLGLGMLLSGGWLTWYCVTLVKRSWITWTLLLLVALFVGRILWRKVKPMISKTQSQMATTDIWAGVPLESAEKLALEPKLSRVQIRTRNPLQTGVLCCVIGVLILAATMIPIRHMRELRAGVRTQGTVTGFLKYYPYVEYKDTEGTAFRFLSQVGFDPSTYKIGDHVSVLYKPGKPASAMIDQGVRNWQSAVMVAILGLTLLGGGVFTLRNYFAGAPQSQGMREIRGQYGGRIG